MPRKSSKARHRDHDRILRVNGWNLRIAWFAILKAAYRLTQVAVVLALIGAIGWGVKAIIQHALYDNPDFRLQVIDLNPNQAIDENDLVCITGLDLAANLFRIDVEALTQQLADRPEIETVSIERHLPGTLVVRVTARTPYAWLACPDAGLPAERRVGALLVDQHDFVYPCPPHQFENAAPLPVIVLPARRTEPITSGDRLRYPELAHCRRLLATAKETDPTAPYWIDTIRQVNAWSLLLTTTDGIAATCGLGDHARQIANLLAARAHAQRRGYAIATINLIPKENVPITVSSEAAPPKAVRVEEPDATEIRQDRRARDLKTLLNRD
jgi:hypothetical protein